MESPASAPRVLKAHGKWLYVEKVVCERTAAGIIIPQDIARKYFKNRPSLRLGSVENVFRARVLSAGNRVEELRQGDEVFVYTFAEGDGSTLYTGENVGEKNRLFVKESDVVPCVLVPELAAPAPSPPSDGEPSGASSSLGA